MNNRHLIVSIMALAYPLMACSDNNNDDKQSTLPKVEIAVSPASLTFNVEGGEQTVEIEVPDEWKAWAVDDSWLTITPLSGRKGTHTLTVSAPLYGETTERKTVINIKCGSTYGTVDVMQRPYIPAVTLNDKALLNYCLSTFDTNNDGILATAEIEGVTKLDINGIGLTSTDDLRLFPDIEELNIADNAISAIDLSIFPKLTALNVASTDITTLDITSHTALKKLDASGCDKLTTINVWTGFSAPADFTKPDTAQYVEPAFVTPAGYRLVWSDEFNGSSLSNDWTHEVKPSYWVNNELQNYVNGQSPDGQRVTEVNGGSLHINCFKENGKIYSGRVYAKVSTGWKYGYFEARLKLPTGKGTWPAFWMMPVEYTGWPGCGEIDIMEEVGCVPNEVSSSIHCTAYNHPNNTQKTAKRMLYNAEGEYHVYALEWTEEYIKTYVDGEPLFTFMNDGKNDEKTWPFHVAFYPIFNLAWGGAWGGMMGVDESALPVTYSIDYIRVFQK